MLTNASIARETTTSEYTPDWRAAHNQLTRLAHLHAEQDYEEARALLVAHRTRAHKMLGFGSFAEYIERIFGWSTRLTSEKLRVAEALPRLPRIAQSLQDAEINWSTARELTRVATQATEAEWLERARGKSMREIERMVSGRQAGDRPDDPSKPELVKHIIHVEVSAETSALWRDAIMIVQRTAGTPLTEDEAIAMIARNTLGGPKDEGRANYQVVLTKCEDCGRVSQRGRGEEIEVSATTLEVAECDAQRVHIHDHEERATQDVPPAMRRLISLRDHGRCIVPGCRCATFIDLHHFDLVSEGGKQDPERMGLFCGAHHKQVHEGRLIVEGRVSTGLTFKHADQTLYGGD
jgi:hypothetical protein